MNWLTMRTALGVAALALLTAACGSTPSTAPTTTRPIPTTTVPKTTTTTAASTTTTTQPNQPEANANTAVTSCADSGVSGTITNDGTVTNTYIISVSDDSGSFELGSGNTQVTNLPPSQTANWIAPVTFSNPPTGPVSCMVIDVLANY